MSSYTDHVKQKKYNIFLDPTSDKEKIKHNIAETIEEQLHSPAHDDYFSHEEIEEAVDNKYEELLDHAKVMSHIPTLTQGDLLAEFHEKIHEIEDVQGVEDSLEE